MKSRAYIEASDHWSLLAAAACKQSASTSLSSLQRAGYETFESTGFPDTRHEEWKYTNLQEIISSTFDLEKSQIKMKCEEHSGIATRALSEDNQLNIPRICDIKRHPLAALNTAFMDGVFLGVEPNVKNSSPINVEVSCETLRKQNQTSYQPRLFIDIGDNSEASIVIGDHIKEDQWSNSVIEIAIGNSSHLELVFQQSGPGLATSMIAIRQESDSTLRSFVCTSEGRLIRNDLEVALSGEGSTCFMRGLFGASGNATSTHHTWVEHLVPRCKSDEIYKGVVSDNAQGSFRGKVTVRPDAQETEASQSNPNLILDDGAEINTKPQLEIQADNVKCAHGSTIGQLDENALCFLRSRGFEESVAKRLLLQGFASSVFEFLSIPELRENLAEKVIAEFGPSV